MERRKSICIYLYCVCVCPHWLYTWLRPTTDTIHPPTDNPRSTNRTCRECVVKGLAPDWPHDSLGCGRVKDVKPSLLSCYSPSSSLLPSPSSPPSFFSPPLSSAIRLIWKPCCSSPPLRPSPFLLCPLHQCN